jgi:hypothetical protein
VPVTVPGAGGPHWLEPLPELPELPELPTMTVVGVTTLLFESPLLAEPLLPELPLLPTLPLLPLLPEQLAVTFSRRFASAPRPKPEANCGSTVTNRTKLATAMTPKRVCRFQRFMFPPNPPQRIRQACRYGTRDR